MKSANRNKKAIVFVHGLLGFSSFSILGRQIHYFRALPPYLRDCSHPIYFPALPCVGRIEERARALANFLGGIDADQIDLIAHSMGGLDCRYLINNYNPLHRIRSLTTIATPHRGTPLAQWVIDGARALYPFLRRITQPAIHDLTPASCARFNLEIRDLPQVKYRSFTGMRPTVEMPLIFRPWAHDLAASDGENDSQVPVASAIWGEFKGTLRADHLELVGWNLGWPSTSKARPFDHLRFYLDLVRELSAS